MIICSTQYNSESKLCGKEKKLRRCSKTFQLEVVFIVDVVQDIGCMDALNASRLALFVLVAVASVVSSSSGDHFEPVPSCSTRLEEVARIDVSELKKGIYGLGKQRPEFRPHCWRPNQTKQHIIQIKVRFLLYQIQNK